MAYRQTGQVPLGVQLAEKGAVQAAEPVPGPADQDIPELSAVLAWKLNKTVFQQKILGCGAAPGVGQTVGPQQVQLGDRKSVV